MTIENLKEIKDLNITEGTKVLLRLDFNVPIDESGKIANTFRVDESLSTIKLLQNLKTKIIIIAHKEEGSLSEVAKYLESKIDNFIFVPDPPSRKVDESTFREGGVILLENTRLDDREKSKDESKRDEFGKELASLADVFVNDAFSASHRDHASITSIPKFLPSCLGPNFIREVENLSLALNPKHPSFLIIGGAKFDTKLPMISKFLNISDKIFVGGALAHSFWKNKGYNLGTSLIDEEVVLNEEVLSSDKIILPTDVMIEDKSVKLPNEIQDNEKIIDFGPETLKEILEVANHSQTIVWNGPLDLYEKGYDWGTKELIENFGNMTDKTIILGGGDTVTEIDRTRNEKRKIDPNFDFKFTHISSGGGAMIDFLSMGTLPGIEAIK